ncbi:HlyC/CorC family transporter [Planctomycetales bacterium ZRK34]|nr:HlyC/CorC family transporter [Planctomycetales bacterium ZRK34]
MPYTFADVPFFVSLPILLIASGFFSGSETALFSLTAHQRYVLGQRGGITGQFVNSLLADPRTLLVTLMLGNMLVNVFYFVVTAALLLKLTEANVGPGLVATMTLAPLLGVIVFGEVLPKLVANTATLPWVRVVALPLYLIHRVVQPAGRIISRGIVQPLGRLFAPHQLSPQLTNDEMEALLEMSRKRGVIGAGEQQILNEVLYLSQMRVRDVMIPRVDVAAIDVHQPPHVLREMIKQTKLNKYIAVEGDLDHVVGVIYARQFLLAARLEPNVHLQKLVRVIRFVPELQRVDQLLDEFRKTGTKMAIAVDEYGGTAGLITLKDIVEQLVGDLDLDQSPAEAPSETTEQLDAKRWRVSGRLSVHDWADAFGKHNIPPRIATVGGLVMSLAGRVPEPGEVVQLANVSMRVESVSGARVESVILTVKPQEGRS